ncbi:MAG TPA: Fe2+-dependent dioxygenase, partial [Dongiaceae bacterium]
KTCREAAALADFVDGGETAGPRATRVKQNRQISKSDNARRPVQELIVAALYRHPEIARIALPHRIRPPVISRYSSGHSYGRHVDEALMGPRDNRTRSDLSCTVFLSDISEYAGGELLIELAPEPARIKLPSGHAVIYPSTFLHSVTEVTEGERLVAATWIQSHIRDQERRKILADLAIIRSRLGKLDPEGLETDLTFQVRANLLRMWSEN